MENELYNIKIITDKLECSYLLDNPHFIDFCNKLAINGMPADKIRIAVSAYHDSHISYKKMYNVLSSEEQVDEWVKGNPIHNNNRFTYIVDENNKVVAYTVIEGGECCPDFSCCGEPIVSEEERIEFKNADDDTRQIMCSKFLDQMLFRNKSISLKDKIIKKIKEYYFPLTKIISKE